MESGDSQNIFNKNRMLQLFIVAMFAIAVGWLSTMLQSRKQMISTTTSDTFFDYRVESVNTNKLDKKGHSIYQLGAEVLTHFPRKQHSLLIQPQLIQHLADGKRVETSARQAILFDDGKTIEMQGNVVMIQKSPTGQVEARTNSNTLSLQLQ